jgi:IS30 family transposase
VLNKERKRMAWKMVNANKQKREKTMNSSTRVENVKLKLEELFDEIMSHDGFGQLQVDVKILKRGQKEIILKCGREYRYVVGYNVG